MQKKLTDDYQRLYAPYGFPDDFAILYLFFPPDDSIKFLTRHNTLEIGYCLKGSGKLIVENKTFKFQKGDISVINSSEYHNVTAKKGSACGWYFIEIDPERLLSSFNGLDFSLIPFESWHGMKFNNIVNSEDGKRISMIICEIVTELKGGKGATMFMVRCLASELLFLMARILPRGKDRSSELPFPERDMIAPALQYIDSHFNEEIKIGHLASLCHISVRYLDLLFKKTSGKTPVGYLNQLRIQMSKSLLASKSSRIIEVSSEVGYGTLSCFTRYFKKETGLSPKKWQQKYLKDITSRLGIIASRQKVQLRFAYWGDIEEIKVHGRIKDAFEKENPDIQILLEHTPHNIYYDRLLASTSTGNTPDISYLGSQKVTSFGRRGIFLPLDDYVSSDSDLKIYKYYKNVVEICRHQGSLYIIPRDVGSFSCVCYNKDMFDKEGIPYPTEDWTLKKLAATAKKFVIKDDSGDPKRYGYCSWFWINILYSFGGRLVDNSFHPKQFLFTSRQSLDALLYVHDMMYKHQISPTPMASDASNMDVLTFFYSGKSAMLCTGIWDMRMILSHAKFDWDIAPFPDFQKGIGGGGSGYGICKGTKYPDQAWRVLKFFAGTPGQKIMAESGLIQPSIVELSQSKIFLESTSNPKNKTIFDKAVEHIVADPQFEGYDEFYYSVIFSKVDMYFSNKIRLNQLKTDIDEAVRRNFPWLAIPE